MPQPSTEIHRLVSRLRFRHLSLLIELQRCGSLRAAAAVLNQTQPALSKALTEIESAFGLQLFTRSGRGLVPTPQGSLAIRGAVLLLQELAHVHAEAFADPATTLLRIGVPPFVAQGYLPAILKRLFEIDARVRVQLQEERVPRLLQSIREGRLDAVIATRTADAHETEGLPLRHEKLFDADFEVIACVDHPLTRARKVDWQRLAAERWIMPAPSSMVHGMLQEIFWRQGVPPPQAVIESTSPVTNVLFAATGLGLAVVPGATLRAGHGGGRIKRVCVRPPIPSSPVSLISRNGPENPRLALLREALGDR